MTQSKPEIIPAILSQTIGQFQEDLQKLINSKRLSSGWVHVDFMDNQLVPNQSILPEDLQNVDFGNLKKEAHLMVKNPLNWVKKLLKLGFERIIIHLEANQIRMSLKLIRGAGKQAVLAINPQTPVEKLDEFAAEIDRILVMGVHPGFQGQVFIPETVARIKKIKSFNWPVIIEVDGAVKDRNANLLVRVGADTLIIGSFLINGNPDENLEKLTL
ncbi:ribulose-phosphate 3-epimerase [Candidatus Daviesbacteria bacterium]|nr:ribulose-phosphate 3-epimerase [Candidatus Daviesbacteria bacterium]